MDKRYQVFVSSTFNDLQEERQEVMQALLELDCMPAGMELFPAANETQLNLIKRVIDDCDYYGAHPWRALRLDRGGWRQLYGDGVPVCPGDREADHCVHTSRPREDPGREE